MLLTAFCKNPECKNGDEKTPIRLPAPTLPGKAQHPTNWPEDWQATLACPACDHVFSYSREDVRLEISRKAGPADFSWTTGVAFSIGFLCGISGCGTHVTFHAWLPEGTNSRDVLAKLGNGGYMGACSNGHPYTVTEPRVLRY
jgi:hypothetical protein